MRRRQGHVSSVTQYGPLSFDHGRKQLQVHGVAVGLTTREAQVMDVLLRRVGQIISKEEFVQEMDPDNMELNSSAIEVYMHRIRKKVSADVYRFEVSSAAVTFCANTTHHFERSASVLVANQHNRGDAKHQHEHGQHAVLFAFVQTRQQVAQRDVQKTGR